jgi:hypothetical protein
VLECFFEIKWKGVTHLQSDSPIIKSTENVNRQVGQEHYESHINLQSALLQNVQKISVGVYRGEDPGQVQLEKRPPHLRNNGELIREETVKR